MEASDGDKRIAVFAEVVNSSCYFSGHLFHLLHCFDYCLICFLVLDSDAVDACGVVAHDGAVCMIYSDFTGVDGDGVVWLIDDMKGFIPFNKVGYRCVCHVLVLLW